jgi:hypothetical protein
MAEIQQQTAAARSVGRLQVGEPVCKDGLFSCDFLYSATVAHIGEDEIKSVSIEVEKQFTTMLKKNGFWKPGLDYHYEKPAMRQINKDLIHIICCVRIPRRPIEIQ